MTTSQNRNGQAAELASGRTDAATHVLPVKVREGIATVRWEGVLSTLCRKKIEQAVSTARRRGAWGIILDFTPSLLLISDAEIAECLTAHPYLGPWCPVAVVASHQVQLFAEFQRFAANRARYAGVFPLHCQALAWILPMAQIYREMSRDPRYQK